MREQCVCGWGEALIKTAEMCFKISWLGSVYSNHSNMVQQ